MDEQRVRVGVVGAGDFAEACHVPGIQAHPRGQVVALCARNLDRLRNMAARLGVPDVYVDYRDLIARPEIDAITVATPDELHLPVAVAALQSGKHVFCEKPLAMTVAEAQQMMELADRTGLIAMVAFTFRYTRALPALRRLLRDGAIGTPFYVQLQVHWGGIGFPDSALTWRELSTASAAGVWGDGASHLFDALAYALAPVHEVCAQTMIVLREPGRPQPGNVDLATCLARLRLPAAGRNQVHGDSAVAAEQGLVHVSLLTSRVDRPLSAGDTMYVVGTHGAVEISLNRGQQERAKLLQRGGDWRDLPLPADARTDQPRALSRMMSAFVDGVLRGRLNPEDPDFHAGLHSQRALEAAIRSTQTDRWQSV
jgi:predicted dehydrogenase